MNSVPSGPPPRRGALANLSYYYRFATNPIGFVAERFERYGDIYYVPGTPDPLYVLRHPDHLYQVLVENPGAFLKQHTAFERLSRVLGNGLLNSDGDEWRRQRRMIQPAFQRVRLVRYAEVMRDESAALAASWRDGQEVDMGSQMMQLTLNIVCRTLFSHDVGGESAAVARAMATLQTSATRPDILPAWMPSPFRNQLEAAVADLDAIMFRMIRQRQRERRAQRDTPHDDLLERLVAAVDEEGDGQSLTETEIRDQLVTLFLAGHETTAQALTWTWYLLAKNPLVEAKLRDELARVLNGRPPGYDDLAELSYTEQVLKETMRLYPPVYMVARRAGADTEVGGYEVPKGAELALWIYMTQRDARWFPDPLEMRPERFEPADEARLPSCAYLPFGAGPRTCIGKHFAMIEAKIALATLVQAFHGDLVNSRVDVLPRITLTPKRGVRISLRRTGHAKTRRFAGAARSGTTDAKL